MSNLTNIKKEDRIIVALDVNTFDKMKDITLMLGDSVFFYKGLNGRDLIVFIQQAVVQQI